MQAVLQVESVPIDPATIERIAKVECDLRGIAEEIRGPLIAELALAMGRRLRLLAADLDHAVTALRTGDGNGNGN